MVKNQHVVLHEHGWAVLGEGNVRPSSVHPTQQLAEQAAIAIAKNQEAEVLVHGRNGRIRKRNTYGKDPFPPPG